MGPIWVLLLLLVLAFPASLFVLLRRAFGPGSSAVQRAERLQW